MPQYAQPWKHRILQSTLDAVRNHPHFPEGSRTWDERVFHPNAAGEMRPLSTMWPDGHAPRYLSVVLVAVRLLGSGPVSETLRMAWNDRQSAGGDEDGGALNAPAAFGIGEPHHIHTESLIEMSVGLAIGAITFSGSLIAFAKLQALMKGTPITFKFQHQLNLLLGLVILALIVFFVGHHGPQNIFWAIAILAALLGFLLIIPIGGADMPVVVSMLNSYSGWAACGIGFTIGNLALIITGALVGASGAILSYVMCKGMNRSIFNVLLGGFGTDSGSGGPAHTTGDRTVKSGNADDAAFIMKNASKVIIVPGYGMAVARPSTPSAKWPTSSKPKASTCVTPSTPSPAACPAT